MYTGCYSVAQIFKGNQNLTFHNVANQRSGGVSIMEPDHPDAD